MYKFKKLDNNDEFMLMYEKDKSIKFKRTIKTAQRLQSIDSEARFRVIQKISEMGYTMDNNPFIVIKKEGSKTIRDESNFNYLIEEEKNQAMATIISEIIEDTTKYTLDDILIEIGVNPSNVDDVLKFTTEFMYIIRNGEVFGTKKTPSPNN